MCEGYGAGDIGKKHLLQSSSSRRHPAYWGYLKTEKRGSSTGQFLPGTKELTGTQRAEWFSETNTRRFSSLRIVHPKWYNFDEMVRMIDAGMGW